MSNMVTINRCCAICEHLHNQLKCPLYDTYSTAESEANQAFERYAKYRACCDTGFLLNKQFNTIDLECRASNTIHKMKD